MRLPIVLLHLTDEGEIRGASGRPKDPEKRAAILRAARDLFFERGFSAVTIEAVAAAAAVSRVTVYGHFGDKETLFAAVVKQQGEQLSEALARSCAPVGCDAVPLRQELIAFGCGLLKFLLDPRTRAFNRLVAAEAIQHPELARLFAESGPRGVAQTLGKRIAHACAAGEVSAAEPMIAARHLIGLFRSIETSATSLGLSPPPSADEIDRYVAGCVDVFLRGYA